MLGDMTVEVGYLRDHFNPFMTNRIQCDTIFWMFLSIFIGT